ncbi:hypothetical protein VYU27_009929 [Nannochloropsis oceanica]
MPRQAPPFYYPLLGRVTAGFCVIDMLVTTILFLCIKDLWQTQFVHYKYATSVADVVLLSFFRAGPGTWVLWRVREQRKAGIASSSPSLKKKLTHQASFMVFKTWLSFLALLGKSSQFRRWDGGLLEGIMFFTLVSAGCESLGSVLLLAGVRKDTSLPPSLSPSSFSSLDRPLLQPEREGEKEDVERGEGGKVGGGEDVERGEGGKEGEEEGRGKKGKASVSRLLALSKPERGLIVLGTVALLLSSISTMFLPAFIGKLIDDVGGPGGGDKDASEARHSLDTSVVILLVVLLLGSLFTFVR